MLKTHIALDINTYNKIIKVLEHLWHNDIPNDLDNEIANTVFELLTEELNDNN